MKDYALEIKVKNNYLLTKMRERGIMTGAELARKTGIGQPTLYNVLALKEPALTKKGTWRSTYILLSKFFNCMPEELVPRQHLEESLVRNTATVEIGLEDLKKIGSWATQERVVDPLMLITKGEAIDGVQDALSYLKPRERQVITMRFGLDGESPATLKEIGDEMGCGQERVRQIEALGMRKLRHPVARSKFTLESHMQTFDDVALH